MKSEWEFKYNSFDFIFDRIYKYTGTISEQKSFYPLDGYPEEIAVSFRIEPDKKLKSLNVKDTGTLYITISLPMKKAEPIVYHLLHEIVEKINYQFGRFEIIGGMILGTHIPENNNEENELGNDKHFLMMRLAEVTPEPIFNSNTFLNTISKSYDLDIMSIYNLAKKSNHPIEKFLGLFKIIENRYKRKNEKLKVCLNNEELQIIYKSLNINENVKTNYEFTKTINKLVDIRHNCVHLNDDKKFGYLANDPRIPKEVEYYLPLLENITYIIIENSSNKL